MKFERIKDLRLDNDLTQEDISKYLYMKPQQYYRYEKGIREIPITILIMLADYYDVSLDYICGRTNRKEINK